MVISNIPKLNCCKKHLIAVSDCVKYFRTKNAIIALCVLLCSTSSLAQKQFNFELSKNVISPSEGPKFFGYMGTLHYTYSENLGISVATGYLKIEESNTYYRDQKNSLIDYENVTDLKIIPLIFGWRYNLFSMEILETFLEADSGLNLLIFEENLNNRISKNHEIHLGIGMGGGANLLITDYLKLVMKCKLNVASKIGTGAFFHERSRYVTFSTGLQVGL